jgi:hypothetical protein
MAPAGERHSSIGGAMSPCRLGDSTMKTLSIATAAIFLALSGVAMAGHDSESQQGSTNATGPNPFMPEFSTPVSHGDADTNGYSAFGQYRVPHHVVKHQVKR